MMRRPLNMGLIMGLVVALSACGTGSPPGSGDGSSAPDAGGGGGPDGGAADVDLSPDDGSGGVDAPTSGADGGSDGGAPLTDGGGPLADAGDPAPGDAAAPSDCLPNDLFFEKALWAPIFSITCVGCHNPSGLAKTTDLVFDITDTPEALVANLAVAESIAQKTFQGVPVLLLKPSNQHPEGHAGGEVVPVGSPGYAALEAWVGRVTSDEDPCLEIDAQPAACQTISPGPPMLRLLNRAEYDRTIEALFDFPSTWGAGFTPENVLNGFDNQAEVLVVPPLLAEQFRDAAEAIAAQSVLDPGGLPGCEACAACRDAFITAFGRRAFQRPLTAGEVTRYALLHDATAIDDGFIGGIELVVTAMLQSPSFLYRRELGVAEDDGTYALTANEVASFLSYFLWGTMPDAGLFARADDGTLTEPTVLAAEVDRLLDDPRSAFSVERFARQWLDVERLPTVPKDPITFPTFTAVEREAMTRQTLELVRRVAESEDGTLSDLLTGQVVFVDDPLAAFYGLPAPEGPLDEAGFGSVDTFGTPYGGLLTDGGILTTHAFSNGSSPVHRGKFVREQLFCQHLPPPPPGLVAEPPAMDPTATTRERFSAHSELEECAGCHRLMDPIGFAFEHFDGVGRFREDENGLPIDVSGEIVGTAYTNATFEGTDELAALLAESPEVDRCFAQQWVRYAYGMESSAAMTCMLDDIATQFSDSGRRVRALLRAVATSVHATRRADVVIEVLEPEPPPLVEPDAGSTDADAGSDGQVEPPDVGPEPDPTLTVVVVNESVWGDGFCDKVDVTNDGATSSTWSVTLAVDGVLTQVWEAVHAPAGDGGVVFQGATWNHTLAPGATTSFGYCADTTLADVMDPGGDPGGPSPDGLDISIVPYTEWGTGYCANGSVTNIGDSPTTWGFTWPVEGEIYNVWEANAATMGDEVYFTGVASNATLSPGQSAAFGFCANL